MVVETILSSHADTRAFDVAQAIRWVQSTYGKSVGRQMAEMGRAALRQQIKPMDFLLCGLFAPDMTASSRSAFISDKAVTRLNTRLNALGIKTHAALLGDKILLDFVLRRLGLPMPRLKAHVSTQTRLAEPATISTPEGLIAFLRSPGALPAFGKPVFGSLALGAASFTGLAENGQAITLGDGRAVPLTALASEIFARYPEGYIFQDLMQHGLEMEALSGPTIAMARIVTVQSAKGPQVLYGVLRLPAVGAMVDATLAGRSMAAWIEPETGRILRVQDMYRMSVTELEAHPVTGARFAGFVVPQWKECCDLVLQGHAGLPDYGILGWDVGVAASGPVVTEVNTNPRSGIFQRASRQGFMNPAFRIQLDAAQTYISNRMAAKKARADT